jgi:membrane protease YdiL (CAAX protease family)
VNATKIAEQRSSTTIRLHGWIKRRPLRAFFLLAYAISWTAWLPALAGFGSAPVVVLFFAGGLGPAVSALIVMHHTGGSLRDWARSVVRWRVPARYYLFALGLPAVVWAVINLELALVGEDVDLSLIPGRSASYAATFVFVLIIGGGLEEPGWRGFALPRLQTTRGPVRATLLLGALWGLWHVPLYGLGAIGPLFFAFPYTYLYNKTRSVMLCVLLHASFTPAQDHLVLLPKNHAEVTASLLMLATLTATAMVLVAATRRTLGHEHGRITVPERSVAELVGIYASAGHTGDVHRSAESPRTGAAAQHRLLP